MNQKKTIKIGTRGSTLALWQAKHVQALLNQHWPAIETQIVIIKTSGDWSPQDGETRLSERQGGKAQFAKEIEEQLLSAQIDIAVHSMKDMDSQLPDGLEIACILPREDARDALLLRNPGLGSDPARWPEGTHVGTSSLRRQAMLLALNPTLNIHVLRGNLETRISKLRGDLANDFPDMQATLLAVAGLNRLNMAAEINHILPAETMLPAAAQGAIGIEIASKNAQDLTPILSPLNCSETFFCVTAERAVLASINGTCRTPIGIHARINAGMLQIKAQLLSEDGMLSCAAQHKANVTQTDEARRAGEALGQNLLKSAPAALLESVLCAQS